MTIKKLLNWARNELNSAKISEAEPSAVVLLCGVLGISRSELLAGLDKKVSKLQEKKYRGYISRRKKHESVWHILGYKYFWGLELLVDRNVLVPRPETEMLVENAVNYIWGKEKLSGLKILDVGTGSGAIAIALGAEFPEADITAVDISENALSVAKKNAKRNGIRNVTFKKSNLFANISGKFSVITANLPYIPEHKMKSLSNEVRLYDPALALDGGKEGLEVYEKFFEQVSKYLALDGALFVEIGEGQGKSIEKMVKKYLAGFSCTILTDFANIDRIGIIKKRNKEV